MFQVLSFDIYFYIGANCYILLTSYPELFNISYTSTPNELEILHAILI